MNTIHPTAIVSSKAELGNNITIHPYAIIEDNVKIGDNCTIGPNAVIYSGARIGNRVKIHQSASVANVPQDLKFANEESLFIIGDDTIIREFVTLHRGTKDTGFSQVGNNCLLMAYSHIAHDCKIGNNCILSNGVQIAGHVTIEDYVIIGGLTPVHQFCIVGQHAMIGGGFRAVQDVPPYILAANEPLEYKGLNLVGLRRRGFLLADIDALKKAYGYIYNNSYNVSQAKEKILCEFGDSLVIKNVLDFLAKSKRGLIGK
jgi:UDP-N-acetylglucosamine acyltransferase